VAVLDRGSRTALGEARLLGLIERRARGGEEAAAVLAPGAEEEAEEFRRQRVVLLVAVSVATAIGPWLLRATSSVRRCWEASTPPARSRRRTLPIPLERARAEREVGNEAGAEQAVEERVSEPRLCHRA